MPGLGAHSQGSGPLASAGAGVPWAAAVAPWVSLVAALKPKHSPALKIFLESMIYAEMSKKEGRIYEESVEF